MGTGLTDRNPTRGWSISQKISNQHADMDQCCLLLAFIVVSDCVDATSSVTCAYASLPLAIVVAFCIRVVGVNLSLYDSLFWLYWLGWSREKFVRDRDSFGAGYYLVVDIALDTVRGSNEPRRDGFLSFFWCFMLREDARTSKRL